MDAEQQNLLKQAMQIYGNESNKWARIASDPIFNFQNFTAPQLAREWRRLGNIGDEDHQAIEGELAYQRAREINNLRVGMQRYQNDRNKWQLIRDDNELGLGHKTSPQLAYMWRHYVEDVDLDPDEVLLVMP